MGGRQLRRVSYRIRQFVRGLTAGLSPLSAELQSEARRHLPAEAWPLFAAMPRSDQDHSLRVLARLQETGHDEPALMQAALLHDAAKAASGLTLLHRVAIVVLQAAHPATLTRWAAMPAPRRSNFRYAFWAHARHAERGAAQAAAAGCSALTVTLIRRHQNRREATTDDTVAELLAALQAADDDN